MRIQILIPDELSKPMGGMGEQARQILKSFSEGYFFDVIGSANGGEYSTENVQFHSVREINNYNGNPDPLASTFLNQSLFIEKSTELKKPDIIHAFDWSTFYAGRILAKRYGIPLVVTIQLSIDKSISTTHLTQAGNHQMAVSMEVSGMLDASVIIQVSHNYAKLFNPIFNSKTVVIPNGINLDEWIQTEQIKLPGSRKKKVIYIGRFAEMKNVLSILKAKIPDNVDVIFIGTNKGGSSEIQDAVIDACKKKEQFHYVGAKYGQEKINWLMSADGMIVPSVHEPFGIVALEALASNNILLSSFVGGMQDFLTEDVAINCGITPESISNALLKFSKMSQKEEGYRISKGLQICRSYSWDKQANKLKQVYDAVLNST